MSGLSFTTVLECCGFMCCAEMKGLDISEQNRRAGQRWQSLPDAEKGPYIKKAEGMAQQKSKHVLISNRLHGNYFHCKLVY